jgi:CHAD domain-containing protein
MSRPLPLREKGMKMVGLENLRSRCSMIEREIKLSADAGLVLPDLTDAKRGISVGPRSILQLDATYYDTPSLALARWGVTLRSRTGEPGHVWTLKLPVSVAESELSRHEFTFDGPIGPVPAAVRQAVRAYVRTQDLGPVVRLHTERITFPLEIDGRPVAMVCDDTVVADGAAEPISVFREIEVEFVEAAADSEAGAVESVVSRLRAAGCKADDAPVAKALRALGQRAFDPPDVVMPKIGKQATVEAVVRLSLAKSVTQLIAHHAGMCAGDDTESLHQFRVAARRLRSDLRTFMPLLDRHWTTWLRDELAWLGGEVGIGRDADVLAERLRSQMARLPDRDAKAVGSLLQRLAETTSGAYEHVMDIFSTDRYVTLLDSLVESARAPKLAGEPSGLADSPARKVFIDLIRKPWKRLERAVEELTPNAPDAALHAIRIKSKRARYAAEAVAPLYGREAGRLAKAVAEVQSVLGKFQDTTVAEAWLREAAKALPSTRLVAGELIGFERDDRTRLRAEFEAVWKKASRRKLHKWLDP